MRLKDLSSIQLTICSTPIGATGISHGSSRKLQSPQALGYTASTPAYSQATGGIMKKLPVPTLFALLLGWGMRHLLPDRSEMFWIMSALIAAIFGRFGDLILSVIRRDLGIKNTGVFIFGRDDILTRLEKLIFVGPMFFYTYLYIQQVLKP